MKLEPGDWYNYLRMYLEAYLESNAAHKKMQQYTETYYDTT